MHIFYTPPPQKIFEEVKIAVKKVWAFYNPYHEKIEIINKIQNISSNFMGIIQTLDINNQKKLSKMIGKEAKEEILKRLEDDKFYSKIFKS